MRDWPFVVIGILGCVLVYVVAYLSALIILGG